MRATWPNRSRVKSRSVTRTNGAVSTKVATIATSFGTKESVASWTWVSAWTSEIATPTRSATSIPGAPTLSITQTASRAMSVACSGVTGSPSPLQTPGGPVRPASS